MEINSEPKTCDNLSVAGAISGNHCAWTEREVETNYEL